MCGITGVIGPGIEATSFAESLPRAVDTLRRRGPDDDGYYIGSGAALGQTRLSIIDLVTGKQPIYNEDWSLVVVFNGEIYNYHALRGMLLKEGHTFETASDTEVIVHLYEEYGDNLVEHLDGMFAFALWDSKCQRALLARDRFGKKPLFWSVCNGHLYFGSELRTLLAWPEIRQDATVSCDAFLRYMLYGYVPSPYAILEGVHKLRPAHLLTFEPGSPTPSERTYWDLPADGPRTHLPDEDYLAGELDNLLREAVRKRLIADVPVGMFLSGGIDSSLIASYIKELAPGMTAYTIAYRQSAADESAYAQKVADTFDIRLERVYFDDEDLLAIETQAIYDYLDEPLADPAIIPLALVSRVARQSMKVVLSGDGGDELFAGYPKYHLIQHTRWLHFLPSGLINVCAALASRLPASPAIQDMRQRLIQSTAFSAEVQNLLIGQMGLAPTTWKRLIGRDAHVDFPTLSDVTRGYSHGFHQRDFINRLLYLDCKVLLTDGFLVKVDRATMAASLEGRTPYLDRDLSRFVMHLPSRLKLRRGVGKYLLKRLAEQRLPYDIVHRPKTGFASPVTDWLRGPLREMVGETLSSPALDDYFHRLEIDRLWARAQQGSFDAAMHIWRAFAFGRFLNNLRSGLPLPKKL